MPLYAQGHSVVSYLISQGGKRKFVDFVGAGMATNDWNSAIQQFYGFQHLSDLQMQWNGWVASGSPLPDANEQYVQAEPANQSPRLDQAQLASLSLSGMLVKGRPVTLASGRSEADRAKPLWRPAAVGTPINVMPPAVNVGTCRFEPPTMRPPSSNRDRPEAPYPACSHLGRSTFVRTDGHTTPSHATGQPRPFSIPVPRLTGPRMSPGSHDSGAHHAMRPSPRAWCRQMGVTIRERWVRRWVTAQRLCDLVGRPHF